MVPGSTVKSAQSSEEIGSLGVRDEGKALDASGSMAGSPLDGLGRVVETGVLGSVLAVVVLVVNEEGISSSGTLLGGRLSSVGLEADGSLVGEALSAGVVEAGQVGGIRREALSSAVCSLGLSAEAAVISGQCPQDAAWLSHI